jgi:PAS domain S-box-containing protein
MEEAIITILAFLLVAVSAAFYLKWRSYTREIERQQKERNQRVYELAILKEIGERIGYELDIERVMGIISNSLEQFLDHTAVAYMLVEPKQLSFNIELEHSVSRPFVNEVRDRMLESLSALLDRECDVGEVKETVTGALVRNDIEAPVRSFFNIPVVINDQVVGILTVAHTKSGLYQEEEMTILYKIVHQASRAVERLQEVVRTEQGRMNAMVESMVEGVLMTDTDYRALVVNPAARQVIGARPDEKVTIFDFVERLGSSFDIHGKLEQAITEQTTITDREVRIGERYYHTFVAPVADTEGVSTSSILGAVVIFHDITTVKQAEQMRERLTSMIVHELRSPIDGIRKVIELFRADGVELDEEQVQKYYSMMHENAEDMLGLINDLYDVSRLESGDFPIERAALNIKDVLQEAVSGISDRAKRHGVNVKLACGDNIPKQLELDEQRMRQVLHTMLKNAVDHTPENGRVGVGAFVHRADGVIADEADGLPALTVNEAPKALEEKGDSLVIAVSDTGEGMSAEKQATIFDAYTQFEQSAKSDEREGSGLGIVIAKGIVEMHGGSVFVSSALDVGTTFYCTIPIAPENLPTNTEDA